MIELFRHLRKICMSLHSITLFRASVVNHLFDINEDAVDCLDTKCLDADNNVLDNYMDNFKRLEYRDDETLTESITEFIHGFSCYSNINYK